MMKIKDSIFKFLKLDNLIGSLTGYVETRLELYKIEIREDVGKALSKALVYAVLGFFAFLFLIFFSIGLAHFINSFLTVTYAGYWIVAAFYGVTFFLMIIFKKDIDSNFEKRFVEMTKRKEK
jgi:uncharacterized membrane protein YqjE